MLRVWYLFLNNRLIRISAAILFVICLIASIVLVVFDWPNVRVEVLDPGFVPESSEIAWVYVPSLIIHSALFALKVYRFAMSSGRPRELQMDTFLWRFIKE